MKHVYAEEEIIDGFLILSFEKYKNLQKFSNSLKANVGNKVLNNISKMKKRNSSNSIPIIKKNVKSKTSSKSPTRVIAKRKPKSDLNILFQKPRSSKRTNHRTLSEERHDKVETDILIKNTIIIIDTEEYINAIKNNVVMLLDRCDTFNNIDKEIERQAENIKCENSDEHQPSENSSNNSNFGDYSLTVNSTNSPVSMQSTHTFKFENESVDLNYPEKMDLHCDNYDNEMVNFDDHCTGNEEVPRIDDMGLVCDRGKINCAKYNSQSHETSSNLFQLHDSIKRVSTKTVNETSSNKSIFSTSNNGSTDKINNLGENVAMDTKDKSRDISNNVDNIKGDNTKEDQTSNSIIEDCSASSMSVLQSHLLHLERSLITTKLYPDQNIDVPQLNEINEVATVCGNSIECHPDDSILDERLKVTNSISSLMFGQSSDLSQTVKENSTNLGPISSELPDEVQSSECHRDKDGVKELKDIHSISNKCILSKHDSEVIECDDIPNNPSLITELLMFPTLRSKRNPTPFLYKSNKLISTSKTTESNINKDREKITELNRNDNRAITSILISSDTSDDDDKDQMENSVRSDLEFIRKLSKNNSTDEENGLIISLTSSPISKQCKNERSCYDKGIDLINPDQGDDNTIVNNSIKSKCCNYVRHPNDEEDDDCMIISVGFDLDPKLCNIIKPTIPETIVDVPELNTDHSHLHSLANFVDSVEKIATPLTIINNDLPPLIPAPAQYFSDFSAESNLGCKSVNLSSKSRPKKLRTIRASTRNLSSKCTKPSSSLDSITTSHKPLLSTSVDGDSLEFLQKPHNSPKETLCYLPKTVSSKTVPIPTQNDHLKSNYKPLLSTCIEKSLLECLEKQRDLSNLPISMSSTSVPMPMPIPIPIPMPIKSDSLKTYKPLPLKRVVRSLLESPNFTKAKFGYIPASVITETVIMPPATKSLLSQSNMKLPNPYVTNNANGLSYTKPSIRPAQFFVRKTVCHVNIAQYIKRKLIEAHLFGLHGLHNSYQSIPHVPSQSFNPCQTLSQISISRPLNSYPDLSSSHLRTLPNELCNFSQPIRYISSINSTNSQPIFLRSLNEAPFNAQLPNFINIFPAQNILLLN